jgi:hypothetical protein
MVKKIKFARFGGLSPVVQKGYTTIPEKRGFHTPPARKGFYAFIWPHYEFFLLGGSYSKLGKKNRQEKFEYVRDGNGNKVKLNAVDFDWKKDEWEAEINPKIKKHLIQGKHSTLKRNDDGTDISEKFWTEDIRDENGDWINAFLIKKKKMKIFTHTGELWHHFNNKAVKPGDIIEESGEWIKTDYDVFVKALDRDKIDNVRHLIEDEVFTKSDDGPVVNVRNVYRWLSKDHMEVFIERIK